MRFFLLGLLFLLEHFPGQLTFGDLDQSDISRPKAGYFDNERARGRRSTASVQLPDSARDDIHQHVGIPNFFQSTFAKFAIQVISRSFPKELRRVMSFLEKSNGKLARRH
jgi:hypothetical protein